VDPFDFDESVRTRGFPLIAGVDEAGRGPIAGPVVAAAVILPRGVRIEGVRDSKTIGRTEREDLCSQIRQRALSIGISAVGPDEIDRINILRATVRAMTEAVMKLGLTPDMVLIDALSLPSLSLRQVPLVRGDAASACIGAASIVAKVYRDGLMRDCHALYPHYGFEKHKGYATKKHLEMVALHGPCPIHRKTFQSISSLALPFGRA
jgi:ribonuclease HII